MLNEMAQTKWLHIMFGCVCIVGLLKHLAVILQMRGPSRNRSGIDFCMVR